MTQDHPLLGFRQDRIGARLICLLDMMRLCERFGTSGRYLWLSQPDGPYPELTDPRDFLSDAVIASHIDLVDSLPDRSGREVLRDTAPGMNSTRFAERLASGQGFLCDSMSDLTRFTDETPEAAAQQVRRIAAGLELAPAIRDALAHARARVAMAGGGQPIAIHVRRGDILDGDPWSYSCWPSKYVPDEFFRAFAEQTDGPVVAFSDTPAAIAHLAQGNPRIVPVAGLFDDPALSVAQRDLLELLLMGECFEVGAPSQSAFSQAASVIGGARIVPLPVALPPDAKVAANDALLRRVVEAPDSFFAPGDLAQSVTYAAPYAVAAGRGAEPVEALADRRDLLERFPFLFRELAVAALAVGQKARARKLARQGLKSQLMRNRDKPQCRQVLIVLGEDVAPDAPEASTETADLHAQFLTMCFTGRTAQGVIVPSLAHRLMSQPGAAAQALLFDPALVPDLARAGLDVLAQTEGDEDQGSVLPLWTLRSDWLELVGDPAARREILTQELPRKISFARDLLIQVEAALQKGEPPERPDPLGLLRLGFCATQLRLHGRLKRSFTVLHWLDSAQPDDVLTHKRLADACFAAGNAKAGMRWLDSARDLAPDNVLLKLSAAVRLIETGDRKAAKHLQTQAAELWPELELARKFRGRLKRIERDMQALPEKRA
ncbi:hypothetical protein [Paracoccus laeviglucosivorans]|uniref:Tetratricopeptide repeat-containing protein n=1 Tax=Paracoccus laeviglucosivorans TaxID=1197861 RepID=A0A521BS43_9RHOB|nr:hypothetical protein [Paracoccus laeviglucosivorans]SMO49350.1 hypothetical protein SAMN06265221_10354 [Paracoccus laeviglucosivorans]